MLKVSQLPHQSLDGLGLDFLDSLASDIMRRERLTLRGLFDEMKDNGFSLQNYLHKNKTFIQEIGREDEFLVRALVDMNITNHLTQKDAYTILCALFDVNENEQWRGKKATRFLDLLVQIAAAGTKKTPQTQTQAGNMTIVTAPMTMASLLLNGSPSFLMSLVPNVLPLGSKSTAQICEILTGKYAGDFSFVFVPVLCELFGQDPKITHMAWRRLLKRPEDHPQWREAVFDLSKVAKSYEDKKALDSALADTLGQKGPSGKPLKL